MVAKTAHLPHPLLLDEVGLEAALYWYVGGFTKRSKIKVDLDYPPHHERLPGEVETALFCIGEECRTNIHRHSGSQTASIRFTPSASEIIFEVRDEEFPAVDAVSLALYLLEETAHCHVS